MGSQSNKRNDNQEEPVLVYGSCQTAFSVVVCLLQGNHPVLLITKNKTVALKTINQHLSDIGNGMTGKVAQILKIVSHVKERMNYAIAIAVTDEDLGYKREVVSHLEKLLPASAIIAINAEAFTLSSVQEHAERPERIIIANWVEPVHTTFFLELVTNNITNSELLAKLVHLATSKWNKDPYIVSHDRGVRALLFSAIAREALHLVENGYATVEDIDRACRNDPGYYLPFAGNCRYIDLMGTNAYGIVMKTLNPSLSNESKQSHLIKNIVMGGGKGMENGSGFYEYQNGDTEKWDKIFRKFSYEIREIISKYPFGQLEKAPSNDNDSEKQI